MIRAVPNRGGDWAVVDDNGRTLADGLSRDEADTAVGELQKPVTPNRPMSDAARLYADRPSRRMR